MLILGARDVRDILNGRQLEAVEIVEQAYRAHACGRTSVPHSQFLTFPDDPANRIIALPAYVRSGQEMAGIKWVSSFPANIGVGMDRASAVVILNSSTTGQPHAILEASAISSQRTAASAALAASKLHSDPSEPGAGFVGCGVINFEIVNFLVATRPALHRLTIFDLDERRAVQFRQKCLLAFPDLVVNISGSIQEVIRRNSLVSIATTASVPHIEDLRGCQPGTVILHVSLRDIAPSEILASDNVTDDIDHVCRAKTSLHLAEQQVGHRRFIRCSIGEILTGTVPARRDSKSVVVFSPFGLGILDISLATMVYQKAQKHGIGTVIGDFLPSSRPNGQVAAPGPGRELAGGRVSER